MSLRSAPRPPAAHAARRSGSTSATTMELTTSRRIGRRSNRTRGVQRDGEL